MADRPPEDLLKASRALLYAAIAADIAAVAALLLPLSRGGAVTELLPLALMLFVASSGLLLGSIGMRKKADAAEREG